MLYGGHNTHHMSPALLLLLCYCEHDMTVMRDGACFFSKNYLAAVFIFVDDVEIFW